jgi:predicted enzyme related to lactoylglutathione lyase
VTPNSPLNAETKALVLAYPVSSATSVTDDPRTSSRIACNRRQRRRHSPKAMPVSRLNARSRVRALAPADRASVRVDRGSPGRVWSRCATRCARASRGHGMPTIAREPRSFTKAYSGGSSPPGPPRFYMIQTGSEKEPGILGSLQGRRELIPGQRMIGFECTISVASIDATADAVLSRGGRTIIPKTVIAGVGTLMFFQDPEGNVFGAMQYDSKAE